MKVINFIHPLFNPVNWENTLNLDSDLILFIKIIALPKKLGLFPEFLYKLRIYLISW